MISQLALRDSGTSTRRIAVPVPAWCAIFGAALLTQWWSVPVLVQTVGNPEQGYESVGSVANPATVLLETGGQ